MSARILGDDDRLLESHAICQLHTPTNNAASQGYGLSAGDLEQMRRNLTAIVNQISGELDVADPDRVSAILDDTNALLQYIDDYQQAL